MPGAILRLLRDQRVRFLLVGGVNTVVGYVSYAALLLWVFGAVPLGYIWSLVVSYAISITLAFVLYRRFVFKVTGHILRDYIRFVGVYLVAICINVGALPTLVEVLRIAPLLAQAIVLVVTTLISFFGHKTISFRRPSATQPDESSS